MKLFVFIVWIFVYIQVKQSEVASIKVHAERMKPKEGAESIPKRQDPKPTGWLWCSDKEPNMTFSYKPCPGDPELEECLRITNVSRKDVIKLMEGNWKKPRESVKKWALCYLSKNGVMSTAGVLRQGAVLRNIPDQDKANVEKTINKCLFKTPHDPVKTAWHYLTCFRSHQPKYAKIANLI